MSCRLLLLDGQVQLSEADDVYTRSLMAGGHYTGVTSTIYFIERKEKNSTQVLTSSSWAEVTGLSWPTSCPTSPVT